MTFTREEIDRVNNPIGSLWILFFVQPIRRIALPFILNRTSITPVHLSIINLVLTTLAFTSFCSGTRFGFIAGAILSQVAFLADSMDGTVAKLKGSGSVRGIILDGSFDVVRMFLLPIGLAIGIWSENKEPIIFILAYCFLFITLAENIIARIISPVRIYKNTFMELNRFEILVIKTRDMLEKKKLRLVFFGFNEREALALFLGPLCGLSEEALSLSVVLAIPFLLLRFLLDYATFKQQLLES